MNKTNLYPKIRAEILFADKEKMQLLLFKNGENAGFIVDGIASEFCYSLKGEEKLGSLIEQFYQKYSKEHPSIKKNIEEILSTLEEEELVEFLDNPVNS